ncbi:HNH endonuclease, partial [bacterium]|nr:HNH endonuclease [bacterium]
FTCQYCGKSSPRVVLEVDHIIPINKGGENNLENLTTSCFDCNRGKGKNLLEEYKEGTDPTEQAILLLERERQLKEYNLVVKKIRKRKNEDLNKIIDYWDELNSFPRCPLNVVGRALDFIPREKILEAIDICERGYIKHGDKSWGESILAYFYGIIRSMTNNFGKD